MKKIIVFILIIVSICINCYADIENEEHERFDDIINTSSDISKCPIIASKYGICIERKTGRVLYEKSAYDKSAMASTTKIMTAILAIENCSPSDIIVVSKKASQINGSILGLEENMEISLKDLLYGLMLRSGNDAAVAIAEYVAGTVDNFAILMNNKAKLLGMNYTNFVTPNGLDDNNHYTCAYDMALLTNYALNNSLFREIVGTKTKYINWKGSTKNIINTNELLGAYDGVYGVKTGFTFNAGRCLITACKKNDLDIIVVILGANTKKDRANDTVKILEYKNNNFEMINLKNVIEENFKDFNNYFLKNININKLSKNPVIEIENKANYNYPVKKSDIKKIYTKTYSITKFSEEMSCNTVIGITRLYSGAEIIDEFKIYLQNDLYKNNLIFYFLKCLKTY